MKDSPDQPTAPKTIGDFREKDFLNDVLGAVASTARREAFDDCVVIDLAEIIGERSLPYLVYSLDHPSFVRHPSPSIPPYRFYGRWLAATTCNDVVAMGARCRGFSLDLAAPLNTMIDDMRELLAGINDVLTDYGATYEGGNFDASSLETVGFCWGLVARHALVRRQGARSGDRVAVTGILGQGWAEYLVRKHGAYDRLPQHVADSLRRYKEMPVAAHRAIAAAAEQGCLSSGMDLSDGLVEFLMTIAERSGRGVTVDAERLPVSPETVITLPVITQLTGAPRLLTDLPAMACLEAGYDSPMVHGFTVPDDRWDLAASIFQQAQSPLYQIGWVTDAPGVRLRVGGREAEIPPFWDDQCRRSTLTEDWVAFLRTLQSRLSGAFG